ncbi:MAG: sigma-54-dependent Fis family transcriptional regulator [Deltaproteobacteria bacterium]|nr:sigma-54-dependent Fis family transcriptional regulator [Deltaproteobacteria bacterium]
MHILVVDDEPDQREMLGGFLRKQGFTISLAATGKEALTLMQQLNIDLALLDHRLPDINGDALLLELLQINPLLRTIMITAYGAVETAVSVMRSGADDFFEKPVDLSQLLARLKTLEQEIMVDCDAAEVGAALSLESDLPLKMVGKSPAMRELLSIVRRAAPTPWTVLIRGETGTGKELVSRLLHLLSPRREHPFVALNCAAMPENLVESELFGHEKGAFTGAAGRRRGHFEIAGGGTLMLDEVGELPLATQAKLLRALQEKKITRVGGEKEIAVDIRLLAATNRDLSEMVKAGTFREDLFYRLKVIEVEIPPLRERREDIPELIKALLERHGLEGIEFSNEALNTLARYHFPGNIRELEHIVQRASTMARSSLIQAADLPGEVRFPEPNSDGSLEERLAAIERRILIEALEKHDWIQTRAADSLALSERVLRYKIGKHKIHKP